MADGVESHYFAQSIGEGELSLEERSGVVFDEATEDLYVADTGHGRIARFGPTGEAPGTFASLTDPTFLALDSSSGDLYAVEEGNETITKLDSSGTPVAAWGTAGKLGGFGKIVGIAVDPSGNLFVVGSGFQVHELTPAGGQARQCELPYKQVIENGVAVESTIVPRGVAVDSDDNIFFPIRHPGIAGTSEAKATATCQGVTERFFSGFAWSSVAIDEADGTLFLSSSHEAGIAEPNDYLGHASAAEERIGRSFGSAAEGVEVAGQLAVRSADEAVYLVNVGRDDISYFPVTTFERPTVEILPPTEVKGTTAHFHALINPEAPPGNPPAWDVSYRFLCENVASGRTGCFSTVGGEQLASGSSPVEVDGVTSELEPASEYRVYVVAYHRGELESEAVTEEHEVGLPFQTAAAAPLIEEESLAAATESSFTLAATINPRGAETGYWAEYVTRAQFEASGFAGAQKSAEEFLAPGIKGEPLSVVISGLAPLSPYVVRFVATNVVEGATETVYGEELNLATNGPSMLPPAGSCPGNESLRAFAGSLLPDCRAYEEASPTNKNGGSVEAVPGSVQAPGQLGDGITFYTEAGIPGGVGAQDYPTFLSGRSGESWTTQGLLPAQALGEFGDFLGMTPDGKYAISEATLKQEGTAVFARNVETGAVTTVVPYNAGCSQSCYTFAGSSEDGSVILLETRLNLTQEPPTSKGPPNVYAWDRATGQIEIVDLGVAGERLPEGGFAGAYNWPVEDFTVGGAAGSFYTGPLHAISADGNVVVFTERGESGSAQLFVRLGVGGPSPHTVKISAYASGQSGPELPAAFLEATPDGRYVFFKSKAELTSDSYSGEGEGTASLYRYDTVEGKLVDVTTEKKTKFRLGPGVEGMLGASESGQVVYFASTTALTTVPGPGGATPVTGEANIYRWQEGANPAISFVAAAKDGELYGGSASAFEGDARDWSPSDVDPGNSGTVTTKTARVSADGNVVVFSSHQSLTGSPNRAFGCNVLGGSKAAKCAEFFRYSAASGTLDCISCSPTGRQPLNGASIGTGYINAADLPLVFASPVLTRNLSADGNRFFFQTPDSLAANDQNGTNCVASATEQESCLDVYEWEAQGEGTCTSASANGGCLYLISGGTGDEPSYFADADAEGKNVFFFTASQLLPVDRDRLYDVYDAREGGGLASQNQVPPVPCGSRQACQDPQASAEVATTPATPGFVGAENPKPPTCKKGYVLKQGKCAKKPTKKKHKKTGSKKKHKKHKKKNGGGSKKRRTGKDQGGKK